VRELILEEVAEHPYVQQRELAALLHELTGLAESTLITLFQKLTRAGELEPGLDGRRRTYRLPMN
jgi:DNA-binding IclR family transcriptional regulator